MSPKAPRLPGSRPGRAAGIENGLERRFIPQPQLKSQEFARLCRQRHAQRLHHLGERAVFEFVDELARHYPEIADNLDQRLERFAALDPALLRWAVGCKFPPGALRTIRL